MTSSRDLTLDNLTVTGNINIIGVVDITSTQTITGTKTFNNIETTFLSPIDNNFKVISLESQKISGNDAIGLEFKTTQEQQKEEFIKVTYLMNYAFIKREQLKYA